MRDAGGMDLSETRIGEERTFFVSAIGRRHIAAARVGRKVKNIPVTAGGQHDCVGRDVVDLTSAQITGNNSLGVSIDDDDVEHFGLGKHLHGAGGDLAAERLITAKQKLLPSLTARIKRSRNLRAAEGAISEQAAVLARERNTLRDALIDNVRADFGEPINVRFARAKVAAFDRVVEQPINAVAVVLIIFRRVDSTLRGYGMRAPWRIVIAKTFHPITEFAQRRRQRTPGEAAADNNDFKFAAIVWTNEAGMVFVTRPFAIEWARRSPRLEIADHNCWAG